MNPEQCPECQSRDPKVRWPLFQGDPAPLCRNDFHGDLADPEERRERGEPTAIERVKELIEHYRGRDGDTLGMLDYREDADALEAVLAALAEAERERDEARRRLEADYYRTVEKIKAALAEAERDRDEARAAYKRVTGQDLRLDTDATLEVNPDEQEKP